jgi:16S rRNA processing protein RimM
MPLARVGLVLSTFGLKGMLKCAYTTDNPQTLSQRSHYLLLDERSGECQRLQVAELQLRAENFLIRFQGHDAPEPLKHLAGMGLYFSAATGQLPREEGEYYYFELAGLEVRLPDGRSLGRVVEVWNNGAGTLIDVEGKARYCLPFSSQYIGTVDLEQGYLVTLYPLAGGRLAESEGSGQ